MVAGAFISSFVEMILERLASGDFRDSFSRYKLDVGLVDKLGITLNSINQVLEEAEQIQYKSTYVKKWLDDLKHAVYEADEIFDEIATEAQLNKLKDESEPVTNTTFESRIKELIEMLELLVQEKEVLGLKGGTFASNNEGVISWKSSKELPTSSPENKSNLYGRDVEKEEIIKFLLSDNDGSNRVPVVTIVGSGGMGKNTLTELVYNDDRIKEHFEHKSWVYVSEFFDVVRLTKEIIDRLGYSSANGEDLSLLQQQLHQRVAGTRYLLVIEDVLNGSGECWEQLLLPFNHGSFGSKIIVTTRDKEVAEVMKSAKTVHLKQLEERDCWNLFVRHAFHGKNASEYPDLESIGKKIVNKCGGSPLALKSLGNLLRMKFSPSEWTKILETDMWPLTDEDNNLNIYPMMGLIYHNFPSSVKRCFAYFSIFPKANCLFKDQLIKLWLADGLLKCCRTEKSEEELGDEFFDYLESISFIQQSLYPGLDNKYRFFMHDLVIDLARSVSGEFSLRIEGDRLQDIPERARHIWCSLDRKYGYRKLENICKIKGLRSLKVEEQRYDDQRFKICKNVQIELFSSLKYLCMLTFYGCNNLSELADEISNLKLLHYLDLSYTGITRLPDSICVLYNLQTLLLLGCKLTELPSNFYKLINLRHLNLESTLISKMPKQIQKLTHLETLTNFVAGEHSGSDIKELEKLNHLRGTLCISQLENVTDLADAVEANLKDKTHLQVLHMRYGYRRTTDGSIVERDVLEVLEPNRNLNSLIIEDYRGTSFPNWLGDCYLRNLVSLELNRCEFCSQFPPLGLLPSLKELSISECDGIEIIGEEFFGYNSSIVPFASLESLRFDNMYGWNEWLCPKGFPSLTFLLITECPKLKRALSQHLPCLERLVIYDCPELEASIPANTRQLELHGCVNVFINELPTNLKKAWIGGTRVIESSLEQILFNSSFLEKLSVGDYDGENLEWLSFDLQSCNSLRTLSISGWCSSSLPFALNLFTNLHSLDLYDCRQLKSFPQRGLPSCLSSLRINKCPELIASREEWGLFELNYLKEFRVSDDFENVESFPEENLLPPTLKSLRLENCSKLRIINYKGLRHLKSLRLLCIEYCPCLERLPEEGLPSSLSTLYIRECPIVKQKYQKEEGESWHTISHIPDVFIYRNVDHFLNLTKS